MKQTTFGELKPGDRFRVNHMNWVKLEEDIGEKVWHPDKMRYISGRKMDCLN